MARLLCLLCLLWLPRVAAAQAFDHAHRAWDALLKKHVVVLEGGKASRVRYAGMARDRAELKAYRDSLSRVGETEFRGWTGSEQMAFLINAYNAFAVEKILTRYPDIRSIWDFGKLFGNPFKDRFFALLGRNMSLDGIEHATLRKPGAYDEPRVHYAVNCASIGCPMLREEAYVPGRLDAQLEEQARRFLSDRLRNRYDPASGRLEVSEIFKWFREDFEPRERYFSRYAELLADEPRHQQLIAEGKAPIAHVEYDWKLNDAGQ
ncbi:MAG TPA: DUF547 domain-containing protein [Burkholderiales bacterium]|jgi:hypothetical protein|nr:DUF547 domain-containing protein [Burkholderiales bacterium]